MPKPQDPNATNPNTDPNAGQDPNAGASGTGGQDPNAGASQNAGQDPNSGAGQGGDEKKYTDADVDELFKKKLAQKRVQMEREIRDAIAKEADDKRTEAEKLASMTELQRAQYEARQLKAEKEALERERDFTQQMGIARKELSDAGINLGDELLEMFVSSEAEKTSAAIDKLKELWPKQVGEAVKQALKRTPPPAEQQPSKKSRGTSYAEKYNKQNGGNE